jgi:hypothetical protein
MRFKLLAHCGDCTGLEAPNEGLLVAATGDRDALIRTHALRIFRERRDLPLELVRRALSDDDAIVQRCAAEVLGAHPAPENFAPLLALLRRASEQDDHLIHAVRIALRDHLRVPNVAGALTLDKMSADELRPLLDIMLAVPGEQTALARLALFEKVEVPADTLAKQLPSLAKNLPGRSARCVRRARAEETRRGRGPGDRIAKCARSSRATGSTTDRTDARMGPGSCRGITGGTRRRCGLDRRSILTASRRVRARGLSRTGSSPTDKPGR